MTAPCGTTAAYRKGCRCPGCRRAAAAYERSRYHAKAAGRQLSFTTAEAQAVVRATGMPWSQVAAHAGLTPKTVEMIMGGRVGFVTARTMRALLAVERDPALIPRLARVSALGASRRVQALRADGYPIRAITEMSGVAWTTCVHLSSGSREFVSAQTDRSIRALFDSAPVPGPSPLAARVARSQGYAPSAAWDDIDDPNATPHFGTDGKQRDARVEDVRWLASAGESWAAIAHRLGVTPQTLERAVERANDPALYARISANGEGAQASRRKSA